MAQSSLKYELNDFVMNWTDSSRRKCKPCVKCGEPTTGRMTANLTGDDKPEAAHVGCALDIATDHATSILAGSPAPEKES